MATWASRIAMPLESRILKVITPPALKPLGSLPERPVAGLGKPVVVIRSFRPKN